MIWNWDVWYAVITGGLLFIVLMGLPQRPWVSCSWSARIGSFVLLTLLYALVTWRISVLIG